MAAGVAAADAVAAAVAAFPGALASFTASAGATAAGAAGSLSALSDALTSAAGATAAGATGTMAALNDAANVGAGAVAGVSGAVADASGAASGAVAGFLSAAAEVGTATTGAANSASGAVTGLFSTAAEVGAATSGAELVSAAAAALAVGALATKQQETSTVAALQWDRDALLEESRLRRMEATALAQKLEDLEERFFQADVQFEGQTGEMKRQFDDSLRTKLDALRIDLRREKDEAVNELRAAQESQLEAISLKYDQRYEEKVTAMQGLLDDREQRILALEAALGDPLAVWWGQVTGQAKV